MGQRDAMMAYDESDFQSTRMFEVRLIHIEFSPMNTTHPGHPRCLASASQEMSTGEH